MINAGLKICQKWDSNPRPQKRTRTAHSAYNVGKGNLESGALDRSAILTCRIRTASFRDIVYIGSTVTRV